MSSKLELPNPGGKRYWDISRIDQYFVVTLRNQFGAMVLESEMIAQYATAESITGTCIELLRQSKAEVDFVGTYKFEENK